LEKHVSAIFHYLMFLYQPFFFAGFDRSRPKASVSAASEGCALQPLLARRPVPDGWAVETGAVQGCQIFPGPNIPKGQKYTK
jgi:hypothetical protein